MQRRRVAVDKNLCKQGKLIGLFALEDCWRGEKYQAMQRNVKQAHMAKRDKLCTGNPGINVSGKTSRSTSSLFARSIQATALLAVAKASMNTGDTWAAATFMVKTGCLSLFSVYVTSSGASTMYTVL